MKFNKKTWSKTTLAVMITCSVQFSSLSAQQFAVSFSCDTCRAPFTGEVVVYTSKTRSDPRMNDNWTQAEPLLKATVRNLKPGQTFVISDKNGEAYPVPPTGWPRDEYWVQAVFDRNDRWERPMGNSTGNHFSKSQRVVFPEKEQKIALRCDSMVAFRAFKNTRYSREVRLRSRLLSDFHGRDVFIAGAVSLCEAWMADSTAGFPLFVNVSGFGGDYKDQSFDSPLFPGGEIRAIALELDGNCPTGHSGYANSEVNGPWGDALVQELIPEVERRFGGNGFRFVTGHSSGGWASLWLQTRYPDFFHGCWSSSPDAFDFRDFQSINLYQDSSAYHQKNGGLIPSILIGGFQPVLNLRDECRREHLLRGQQYRCYSAVYGKKEPDGSLRDAYDFQTGSIDPKVVERWKRYDISLYLRENWTRLQPQLDGKIMLTTGEDDNFLIAGPVARLKRDMVDSLGGDLDILMLPGDHFTVITNELWKHAFHHFHLRYDRWRISKNGFDFTKDLRPGDLIFQDLDCGPLCDAIENVTEGAGGKDFSHLGLVVASGDTLAVAEAIGTAVQLTGIQNFIQRNKTPQGKHKVVVGRPKPRWQPLVASAGIAAKSMIGVPYDEAFLPDNGRLYCSEMVALAFRSANRGKVFFKQTPMTFRSPDTGQYFPAWVDHFKKLSTEIPEGRPGCNPGSLSRDPKLTIIWANY